MAVEGKILKDGFYIRTFVGSAKHPITGENIQISTMGASIMIEYRGKYFLFDIQDLINESVSKIDEKLAVPTCPSDEED